MIKAKTGLAIDECPAVFAIGKLCRRQGREVNAALASSSTVLPLLHFHVPRGEGSSYRRNTELFCREVDRICPPSPALSSQAQ
jgi:hypothetical protein